MEPRSADEVVVQDLGGLGWLPVLPLLIWKLMARLPARHEGNQRQNPKP